MAFQSQIVMQNFNHSPGFLLHDQFNNVTSSSSNVHDVGCNNCFPTTDRITEMSSIGNCVKSLYVDVDSYINIQCEKMRKMVHNQMRAELVSLANKFETRSLFFLNQKDDQIQKKMLQIMELQRLISMFQLENESLRNLANQNKATIESLKQTILQIHDLNNQLVEDAESCCGEADVTLLREPTEKLRSMICGGCDLKEANMVFLPCRHLCSCEVCESEMHECPLCKRHKSSSIMTLVF